MNPAREEILARIRQAGAAATLDTPIPRAYRDTPSLAGEQRIDLFIERLQDYDAVVHRCRESEIAGTINRALTARAVHRLLIPADLQLAWLPVGFDFIPDRDLSYDELDRADGVVTSCTVAIALSGSIVLQTAPGQGRRALTLVPDYHLCVVYGAQIVETLPEAIRALDGTLPTTFISGPSATSDIEMTRIKGVHGPRTLEVILVLDPSA